MKTVSSRSRTKPPADVAASANMGATLRAVRRERDWTLAEVSQRTGLAVPLLSKIENNKVALTYDKLVKISRGLGLDLADLFSAAPNQAAPSSGGGGAGRRSITRAGEGASITTDNYFHLYPAADLLRKQFVPVVADLRARSIEEFGELARHPGEEFAIVLKGSVDLPTEYYAPTRLEEGDSIYFDSTMGHAYIAASPGVCRVLTINLTADVDPAHA